jgi:cysteine desulfurase
MKRFYKHLTSFLQMRSIGLRGLPMSAKSAPSRVYLDNAGATIVGERAKRALIESLDTYGNPSGIHAEGAKAGVLLDKARALCATVLNTHAYEIYFTSSGTESCNLAVIGTYNSYKQNANSKKQLAHMIVSSIEHPAILEPVRMLEKEGKIRVTYLPVYDDGIVKVRDVVEALSDETILVSVMYANNEIGTIQPIKEIGRALDEWKRSHERTFTSYPYFHTDACQAANYCNLDALRLKVHMMTANSSKVYGPKGVAVLYKREGIQLVGVSYGGGQERQLRSGTENVAGAYAFGVALTEAVEQRASESDRLRVLRDETVKNLKQAIPSIVFYGAFDEYFVTKNEERVMKNELRLPNNINCRVPGITSEEMILRLDAKGFAVSHKSACASMESDGSYVLTALGATEDEARENIRISMGRGTTENDMAGLVDAMRDITERYS